MLHRLVLLCLLCSFCCETAAQPIATLPDPRVIDAGRDVFARSCSRGYCHGKDGRAGRGPRLRGRNLDLNYVYRATRDGIQNSSMAGFGNSLSEAEIWSVVAYIGSLSKVAPDDRTPSLTPALAAAMADSMSQIAELDTQPSRWVFPSDTGRPREMTGDRAGGEDLFFDSSDDLNCARCHRISGRGASVGPDLSGISERPAGEILLDIVRPSAAVSETWQLLEMTTRDGEHLEILRVSESATRVKVYDVSTSPPVLRSIKKDRIDSVWVSHRSAMPDIYGERYTLKQLLDIISFLKSNSMPAHVALSDLF